MRVGVSSAGRWWLSMGPLGWLLYLVIVLPVLAAWYLLLGLAWLIAAGCRAAAAHRAPTPPGASS